MAKAQSYFLDFFATAQRRAATLVASPNWAAAKKYLIENKIIDEANIVIHGY